MPMRVEGNLRFSNDSLRRWSPVKFRGMAMSRTSSISSAEGAAELNEGILSGQGVGTVGRDDGIGDAVQASHGNQFRLGVECVVDMHVRHDLVAEFDQIVGAFLGGDFRKAKSGFGIDQAGIDGHACDVDDLGVAGMLTEAAGPTAVILPFCITITPFSIMPWVTVSSLPPLSAMGGLSGAEAGSAEEKRNAESKR